jgi:hypothetical protein
MRGEKAQSRFTAANQSLKKAKPEKPLSGHHDFSSAGNA